MKVKILQHHTHAGEQFEPGSVIELPDDDAQLLFAMQGAQREAEVEAHERGTELLHDAGLLHADDE